MLRGTYRVIGLPLWSTHLTKKKLSPGKGTVTQAGPEKAGSKGNHATAQLN